MGWSLSMVSTLFLDLGTRRGKGVSVTPRPLSSPRKVPVPLVQEAGWGPGPVWTGAENLAPTGIRSPDRPARSQSRYRFSYPAHHKMNFTFLIYFNNLSFTCFEQIHCWSSGDRLLYMEHVEFSMHVRWLAANAIRMDLIDLISTKFRNNAKFGHQDSEKARSTPVILCYESTLVPHKCTCSLEKLLWKSILMLSSHLCLGLPGFSHQNPVHAFSLPHKCYMHCQSHCSQFNHPNDIWWSVQIIKLLIMLLFEVY
jgi:hypothetical protein